MSPRDRSLPLFLLLAFAITWSIWAAGIALAGGQPSFEDPVLAAFLLLGSFGPGVAAVITAAATGGRRHVVALLRTVVQFRMSLWVWAAVLFVPPLVMLGYAGLLGQLPRSSGDAALLVVNVVVAMPVNAAIGVLVGMGPLGEELGWRGFLLPRLIPGRGAIRASLLLAAVWTLWHAPLVVIADWRGASWPVFLVGYPLSLVAISLFITTVWRWGRRSTAIAMAAHAVVNQLALSFSGPARLAPGSGSDDVTFIAVVGGLALVAAVFGVLDRLAVPSSIRDDQV